jgi:hypothetical protein
LLDPAGADVEPEVAGRGLGLGVALDALLFSDAMSEAYLNSGAFFSWSLVMLTCPWSG